jgi:hypothetical protein
VSDKETWGGASIWYGVLGWSVDGRLELALGDWDLSVVSGCGIYLSW